LHTLTAEQLREAEAIEVPDRPTAATYGRLYGGLKAACERAAEAAMSGRVLTIRAGLIVGPHDYTDRFTYWVHRVADGGEVLAPGRSERWVQFIDVRDLSEWTLRMIEANGTGVYNVRGRGHKMGRVLEECRAVSGSDARFTWVSEKVLLESGVAPWTEIPLWLPEEGDRLRHASGDKALKAGLTFRRLADTIRDTLESKPDRPLRAGLTREREVELLGRWREADVL
jgi:2'-hydroxyisoflavone reductase